MSFIKQQSTGKSKQVEFKPIVIASRPRYLHILGSNLKGQCSPPNTKFLSVKGGLLHSVGISEEGKILTWGCNEFGQLGSYTPWLKSIIFNSPKHYSLNFKAKVKSVSAGSWHTGALTEQGDLFTWGRGSEGQLGYFTSKKANYIPTLVMRLVSEVSCGSDFTFVVLQDSRVAGFGNGKKCVLGRALQSYCCTPCFADEFQNLGISTIECGWSHCLAIDNKGQVYMWGDPYSEVSSFEPLFEPVLVFQGAKKVSCGDYHSALVTKQGTLFTWGGNGYSQLGYQTEDFLSPEPSQVNLGESIVDVKCGGIYTVCLSSEGNVFGWGSNRYSQLGKGQLEYQRVVEVEDSCNNKITSIESGHSHTILLLKQPYVCSDLGENYLVD